MPQTVKRKVIKPEYYDKFHCIMAACEENCCNRPWRITIDRKTYAKYRNTKDPVFRKKQEKYVKRIRGAQSDDLNYARFVFDDDRSCPFQTPEGLCEIHRDHGEGYLSRTCRVYPRLARSMIEDFMEMSVTMSCPHAVRVGLLSEEPMEFNADFVEFDETDPLLSNWRGGYWADRKKPYVKHGWAMREAAITIMQMRTCSVAHRIIIIAMMLNDIVELHDSGKTEEIPDVLDYYVNSTYGEEFMKDMEELEQNEEIRLQMSAQLYFVIEHNAAKDAASVFAELINKYKAYAGDKDNGSSELKNAMLYHAYTQQKAAAHWSKFLRQWEHVLENYFVNYIFSELFPLKFHDSGLNPYHHSFMLAEQYALIKMIFCGNYDPGEGFSVAHISRTISHIAQMNQHTRTPLKIVENFKNVGVDSPAHLYYLLF